MKTGVNLLAIENESERDDRASHFFAMYIRGIPQSQKF